LVVVDGQPGAEYDQALSPVFSPDSKHVAYVAVKGKSHLVVVDSQPSAEYDDTLQGPLLFSPDGSLEYVAIKQDKGGADGGPVTGALFQHSVFVKGNKGGGDGGEYQQYSPGSLYRIKYTPTP
jgi:hypothetical protein